MKAKERVCELCNERASLYCVSDSAFLCWKCDAAVHHANFLVARHRRHLLCSACNRFAGIHVSGATPRCRRADEDDFPTCRSCSQPENLSDDADGADSLASPSSSSSSACVSSSEPRAALTKKINTKHGPAKRIRTRSCSSSVTDDDASSVTKQKRRRKGDGSGELAAEKEKEVFVKWSGELGLGLNDGNRVASLSLRALNLCLGKWRALPFKVAAATSFWLGLRFCGISGLATCQNLSKLEAISGVPAKLILPAHVKLARVFFFEQKIVHLQEGCDES